MNNFPISLRIQSARHRRRITSGSALIIAMLLIAVASVLMTGWIAIITARGGMVEQMTVAAQRRVAMENSKALAQEFVLERIIPSTSGTAFSYNLSDSTWGGISVPAWGSAPLLSIAKADGYNHFNPGNGDGYTFDTLITVNDGDTNPQRKYQVKSRSPLLSGILLSSQTPTITPSATPLTIDAINVSGSAFTWLPALLMHFTPVSYATPEDKGITFATSGGSTLMNNFALPRTIANPRTGSTLIYTGQFDAINNSNPAANSSRGKIIESDVVVDGSVISSNGVVCDGIGHVTVTLSSQALNNVYISGAITTLTLQGQATTDEATLADSWGSTLILVDQSVSTLTTVTCTQGTNRRRLVLAVKKANPTSAVSVQFTTSPATWRMLLEAENTPIQISLTGSTTIQGGIRSDRNITHSGGTLNLTLESDPKYLDQLATRAAWVESYIP